MVKISNHMSREDMQMAVEEMSFWSTHHQKYENALRMIRAAGECCPQCRRLTVCMLNVADRMGVLSQVIQTTMANYSDTAPPTALCFVANLRMACRSHGLDVQRFRLRHPQHLAPAAARHLVG
jgi:hypothetical protein